MISKRKKEIEKMLNKELKLVKYTEKTLNSYGMNFINEELNNEIWKPIIIPEKYHQFMVDKKNYILAQNKEPLYYISSLGRCAAIRSYGLVLKCVNTDADGYKNASMFNNFSYFIHRLVAFMFIDNEDYSKFNYVNHKNFIRYDNRIQNLEWCSLQYNTAYRSPCKLFTKRLKRSMLHIDLINGKPLYATEDSIKSYRLDEFDIDFEEQWKCINIIPNTQILQGKENDLIKYDDIYVSSYGRFAQYKNNEFILKKVFNDHDDKDPNNGYFNVSIHHKPYRAHRIVALTFLNQPDSDHYIIDHINRQKWQNYISNLRWATPYDNRANQTVYVHHKIKSNPLTTKIYLIDTVTNKIVKEYESVKSVVNELGISQWMVSNISLWNEKYDEKKTIEFNGKLYVLQRDSKITKRRYECVVQFKNNNALLFLTSDSIKTSGFNSSDVYKCCKINETKDKQFCTVNGIIWFYLSDYSKRFNNKLLPEPMIQLTTSNRFIRTFTYNDLIEQKKNINLVFKYYDIPSDIILGSNDYNVKDNYVSSHCKWIKSSECDISKLVKSKLSYI